MPDSSARPAPNNSAGVPFPARFLATGFYSGYSPVAPGTAGSLAGLALYFVPGFEAPALLGAAIAAIFFAGVYVSALMEKALGEDPPVVVVDEVVGMWISLLFVPKSLPLALLAFLFFRLFDIVKPPPARGLERLRNGWGIMLDDVAAAVYANLAVQGVLLLFPGLR